MRYVKNTLAFLLIFTLILSPVLSLAQDEEGGRTVRLPQAGDVRTVPLEQDPVPVSPSAEEDDLVYLNVQDQDIKDIIKQISKATGKNFIIDDKIRGKVTILSERKMTKEEAYQAFLSALEVGGFTTVTGPGGIIKIVALKDAISSPIPIYVDSTPETDSYVTRLISLQNISALDMSSAIKDLISKNGNMFAYPSTNTLVITDSGTNIDRLMKIIKELDQEGPQQVLEIVPINYADATQVAATVLNIFEIEQQSSRGTTARPTATTRRGATTGSQLEELKEVSKIIADERTNSIIVYASKRAIGKVREVIAKLDVPLDMGEGGNIHVHYLKYANAMEMAETLSAITSGARSMGTAKGAAKGDGSKGAAGTAVASFGDEIKIGADETTNALIITSSAKDYKRLVDELISKLDVPRRQVYLESIVMELSVTRGSTAGATGYGGGTAGSLIGFGGSSFSGMNPAQFFTPTGLFSQPGLLGGLLSRDTITIDIPSSGGGSQELTIPAFAAFLNFLQTQSQANIVSTPNILTLDNQEASIDVSKTIYAKKSTTIANAGTTTFEPTPLEAGLMLKITPQITEGDSVRLQIHHKLSNFTSVPNPDTGAADTTKREIQTTVVAMDGQTVVLGGLMEDMDTSNRSKIPLLGDIPILGWLFQYRSKQGNKTNLLVFITPYVIRDPSDFAEITKRKIQQRNDFVSNNFGRRQQRQINESLAAHRADLLDYAPRPAVPVSSSGQNYQQPGTAPLAVSQPVITVAPLGADGAPQMQYLAPPPQLAPQQSTAPGTPKLNQKGSPDFGY